MPRLAAITYDGLPISSGGAHALRTRGFVETAKSLSNFVSRVSVDPTPVDVALELLSGGDLNDEEFSRLYNDARSRYGTEKFTRGLGKYVGHQWGLDVNDFRDTANRLEAIRPISLTEYTGYQVVLHATWKLNFLRNDSEVPLPFQSRVDYDEFEVAWQIFLGESGMYARISEKSTAGIFLSLPFEEVSSECRELVGRIQNAFPVRLSAKHWKRWTLSKAGKSYVGRKIEAPFPTKER